MKISVTLLFMFLIFNGCKTSKIEDKDLGKIVTSQMLKDYAFCKCINQGLGKELVNKINEVDVSTGMLFELSGEHYSFIDSIATSYSKKIMKSNYSDHGEKKAIIARCLDFHRSKRLDSLIGLRLKK